MKMNKSKSAVLLLTCCMIFSMFAINVFAADEITPIDTCGRIVEEYDAADALAYIEDDDASTYPTCKTEGYVFAGWYLEEACERSSYWNMGVPGEKIYALFVPAHVLGVKGQISANLLDEDGTNDDTAAIRFVTTVDTAIYKQIGFDITYIGSNGTEKTVTSVSKNAYKKLYAVGDNNADYTEKDVIEYTPQNTFCSLSTYFSATTINNISPEYFATEFTIKPFWVTMDGSKVYGETAVKSIVDYFSKESVWVSTTDANAEDSVLGGVSSKPFKTLDYALDMVEDGGTIYIKDSYVADSEFVWSEHDKNITVSGGTIDFTGVPVKTIGSEEKSVLDIQDDVIFDNTTLKFANGQQIYANGNKVEIKSNVSWADASAYVSIFGGAYSTTLDADTCLVLGAGNYSRVYGGNNGGTLNGNTSVTLNGTINSGLDYTAHSSTCVAYGAGTGSSVLNGDTNITIANDTVLFNYVFGGGENGTITGDCNVTYAGKAMSVYAGGKSSKITGNTFVTMTNGWVEQVFGGSESASVTGNTNIDIQDGTVKRRVYGGCYNNYKNYGNILSQDYEWVAVREGTNPHYVSGHTNVRIGANATFSLNYTDTGIRVDNSIYAISRYKEAISGETGAFIFNDELYANTYSSKLGYNDSFSKDAFSSQTYHYLVTTNGNKADGSLGNVSPKNNSIYIEPKEGYAATVTVGDAVEYYAESAGAYALPALASETDTKNIVVTFSAIADGVDTSAYEAKIGNAYYPTFEGAVNAASQCDDATVVVLKDVEAESAMAVTGNVTIQSQGEDAVTINRGSGLATSVMFTVAKTGTLTVENVVFDGRTAAEVAAETGRDDVVGSTASMIANSGTVNFNNVTVQYVKKTAANGDGGVVNNVVGSYFNVKDSVFDNNYTVRYGSVVYSKGNTKFENTEFTNNKAAGNGGVITNHDGTSFEVDGCTFTGNAGAVGGVIWNNKAATITNSTFESNNATGNAGAIQNTGALTVTSCTFNGNASTGHGGAIYTGAATTVENCTFTSNTAASNGGAICTNGSEHTVKNSTFEGNAATKNGGAIYNASNAVLNVVGDGTENSVFANNKALGVKTKEYDDGTYFGGGAICVGSGALTINSYKFSENESKADGGAISFRDGSKALAINDCEFVSNKALKQNGINGLGGAIYMFNGTLNIDVEKTTVTTFDGNHATNGGAIAQKAGTMVIEDAEFTSNIGDWNGGTIYHKKAVTLTGCKFTTNASVSKGGAVCSEGGTLNATNCTFTGNESNDEGGAYRLAASGVTTMTNCTFTNNTAKNTGGGAIKFNTGSLTIDGCTFSGNTATKGDANGHDIKMSTTTTIPTIKNSTINPANVRDSAGTANAFTDGGGNK